MEKPILAAMLSCSGLSLTDAEKRIFSPLQSFGRQPLRTQYRLSPAAPATGCRY